MKKLTLALVLFFAINLIGYTAMAQSNSATNTISLGMPEVLLLQSNSATVNLTLTPQNAGEAVVSSVSSEAARVLISSVVIVGQTRTMSANISAGTVPAGTILKLQALAPNDEFVGTEATLGAEIELGSTALPIITGIGTCYSGTSADDGYVLKYSYGVPEETGDYGSIRAAGGVTITVTLTLSAGA